VHRSAHTSYRGEEPHSCGNLRNLTKSSFKRLDESRGAFFLPRPAGEISTW